MVYVLIGIYKDDNFTFARALLSPNAKVSLIAKSKADELKCIEYLDRSYTICLDELGCATIDMICSVSKIETIGRSWRLRAIFYLVDDILLRRFGCEAIIGSDIIQLLDVGKS